MLLCKRTRLDVNKYMDLLYTWVKPRLEKVDPGDELHPRIPGATAFTQNLATLTQ